MTEPTSLVTLVNGEAVTTSLAIAEGTNVNHKNVRELIEDNLADFSAFGVVRFETAKPSDLGGRPGKYAVLNEPQATLLMTYMRNSPVVKAFKQRLVKAFFALRDGIPEFDLSDPLAALDLVNDRLGQAVQLAREERERRLAVERWLEAERKHRKAIEGGDGINLTVFGKKYFSETPAKTFYQHLYDRGWLIDQRNTRLRADGSTRDGHEHRLPTAKGRSFIYAHDLGNHGGRRRFEPRVRPQREINLRDALAAEGLPVNQHSSGLVLISDADLKELEAK